MLRGYHRGMDRWRNTIFTIVGVLFAAGLIMGPDRVDRLLRDHRAGQATPLFEQAPTSTRPTPATTASPTGSPAPATGATTSASHRQLAALKATSIGSMVGYSRTKFPHWRDEDGNGCDSRADTLRRDARQIASTTSDGCSPLTGEWIDPYGGTTFTRSTQLDIDHLIPLAAAWRLGAAGWTTGQRERYANDPSNLLAVSASLNRQKGDKTAEAWKPPLRSFWCTYARRTVAVHAKYAMGVTASERAALSQMLATCPR